MPDTISQKPVIDHFGNIRVHAMEGLDLPVHRQDAANAPVDISAATLVFYVNGLAAFPLVAGVDNFERRIQVSPTDLNPLEIGSSTLYTLMDESGPTPISLLEGKLKVDGFRV